MNLFGVGNMELIVVLLVALLVLGPARMVAVARSAGKYWNEAQRTIRSVADAATAQLDAEPASQASRGEPGASQEEPGSGEPEPGPDGSVARGGGGGDETPPGEPRG